MFANIASWVSITVPQPGNVAPATLGDRDPLPQPRGIYKGLMRLISGAHRTSSHQTKRPRPATSRPFTRVRPSTRGLVDGATGRTADQCCGANFGLEKRPMNDGEPSRPLEIRTAWRRGLFVIGGVWLSRWVKMQMVLEMRAPTPPSHQSRAFPDAV